MVDPVLLLDTRQPDWMAGELESAGFRVIPQLLETGDFVWSSPAFGRVGVEDKTVSDLIHSRHSGRLDDQLHRLCETYGLAILFIRGDVAQWVRKMHITSSSKRKDVDAHSGWNVPTFNSIDDMLVGRQLRGVIIARCNGEKKIGPRLMALHKYTQKRAQDAPILDAHMPYLGPMTDKAEVIYRMMASVAGIRGKRELSEKLSEVPLRELVTWDAAQWRSAGLSKLMASRLGELLESWQ